MASRGAEKVGFDPSLKAAPSGAPYKPFIFCHFEWVSAHEESALATFSTVAAALPVSARIAKVLTDQTVLTRQS
jgi:hypothetical protein